jgi:hypothetical protein
VLWQRSLRQKLMVTLFSPEAKKTPADGSRPTAYPFSSPGDPAPDVRKSSSVIGAVGVFFARPDVVAGESAADKNLCTPLRPRTGTRPTKEIVRIQIGHKPVSPFATTPRRPLYFSFAQSKHELVRSAVFACRSAHSNPTVVAAQRRTDFVLA